MFPTTRQHICSMSLGRYSARTTTISYSKGVGVAYLYRQSLVSPRLHYLSNYYLSDCSLGDLPQAPSRARLGSIFGLRQTHVSDRFRPNRRTIVSFVDWNWSSSWSLDDAKKQCRHASVHEISLETLGNMKSH